VTATNTAELFNTIAGHYDVMTSVISLGCHRRWRRGMAKFLPVREQLKVLDLGTGTGEAAFAILRESAAVSLIVGIDSAAHMVMRAQHKASAQGLTDHIVFHQAAAEHIPFADESFDAVTVAFGIRNMQHRSPVLQEIRRVLKPEGVLILLELSRPEPKIVQLVFEIYLFLMLRIVGAVVFGHKEGFRYFYHSVKEFPDKKALRLELEKEHFQDIRVSPVCLGAAAIFAARK